MTLENKDIEERADYLEFSELELLTADHPYFEHIREKLFERGAKLIVGPRGTGKTHQMRLAYLEALGNKTKPIAVYTSLNRYYHLEPLLHKAPHATQIFHTWVLCRIALSCVSLYEELKGRENITFNWDDFGFDLPKINAFVSQAETGIVPESQNSVMESVTIKKIQDILGQVIKDTRRTRCVLLLDDAALSLTPDYMIEFFDIYRALKTTHISPKASVYPGTTQYGPRFHVRHDAESVQLWLDVTDSSYSEIMSNVYKRRFGELGEISADIIELLKYASFGVPRVFLTMIRAFNQAEGKTAQQKLNLVLAQQTAQLYAEFESLEYKLPQFRTVIRTGARLQRNIIKDLTQENKKLTDSNSKQLLIAINKDSDTEKPLIERLLKLLIEAGLLYPKTEVSHGEDRDYLRFIPHFALLIQNGAFRISARGTAARDVATFLSRPNEKHALRRKIRTLLDAETLDSLAPDLPPCQNCKTPRLSEAQNFCHQCGMQLITRSSFEECMQITIDQLPISIWQRDAIKGETRLRTVADFLSLQDPASELRRVKGIGKVRSERTLLTVTSFIEEFLS